MVHDNDAMVRTTAFVDIVDDGASSLYDERRIKMTEKE